MATTAEPITSGQGARTGGRPMGNDPSARNLQPTPFVGTRPFGSGEHHLFFGRSTESADLSQLWSTERLTILHGAAGVGKTSLLRAGVIPRLKAELAHVLPIGDIAHRSPFPMAALPEQNPQVFALFSSWFPTESPTSLSGTSISGFLLRHARRDRFGDPVPALAAIDQAEQLFGPPGAHDRYRRDALDQLRTVLAEHPAVHLLLAVRDDSLDAALAFAEGLSGTCHATYELPSLDRTAALEAVECPLSGIGVELHDGIPERLVDELRTIKTSKGRVHHTTDQIDPAMLQLVCSRLWTRLSAEPDPTNRQLADEIDQILAEYCSQTLAMIAADHRVPPRELSAWFRVSFTGRRGLTADPDPADVDDLGGAADGDGVVTPDGTGAALSTGRPPAALAVRTTQRSKPGRIPPAVLPAVENRHLIRVRRRAGRRWYELSPRLLRPIDLLDDDPGPVRRPDAAARLRGAAAALSEGNYDLARHHVRAAIRACNRDQLRIRADAESFLGNIAYEEGDPQVAATHYRKAAALYEAVADTRAVGRLLAAVGRLSLMVTLGAWRPSPPAGAERGPATAVTELQAAAVRVPNDPVVQTLLGQALWYNGRPNAALAVLDTVIHRDGHNTDTLQVRGQFLADLGRADAALRDLDRIDWKARPSTRAARALAEACAKPAAVTPPPSATDEPQGDPGDPGDAADSGPVLLRLARVHDIAGAAGKAADLADRALSATHPPLPPHLRKTADGLLRHHQPAQAQAHQTS